MAQSEEWLLRVTEWLEAALFEAKELNKFPGPMAPEGTPEGWRWSFWIAFTEKEAEVIALLRANGCKCMWPLAGWRYEGRYRYVPRCRLCGIRALEHAWY